MENLLTTKTNLDKIWYIVPSCLVLYSEDRLSFAQFSSQHQQQLSSDLAFDAGYFRANRKVRWVAK